MVRVKGKDWTEQEDKTLAALWSIGTPAGELAKQLPGRTASSVSCRAHRIDLPDRRRRHDTPPLHSTSLRRIGLRKGQLHRDLDGALQERILDHAAARNISVVAAIGEMLARS